jgi:beta-carotene 3-hydroxylase
VSLLAALAVAAVAFVLMEPVTAVTHRFVMHGVGGWLHRSHHRSRDVGWERNDWYPVMFAGLVLLGMWAGFNIDRFGALVPAGVGVTLYGAAYAVVHDVYIHRRLAGFGGRRVAALDRLATAHRIHHLYGGAPYGMLAPVVPRELRARAARTGRDPLAVSRCRGTARPSR